MHSIIRRSMKNHINLLIKTLEQNLRSCIPLVTMLERIVQFIFFFILANDVRSYFRAKDGGHELLNKFKRYSHFNKHNETEKGSSKNTLNYENI